MRNRFFGISDDLDLIFWISDDFNKPKKMRNVRTIIFHPFSRRDLCHVSENKGFRFVKKTIKTRTILCPGLFCVQDYFLSRTILCPGLLCVQDYYVSRTIMCPGLLCVQDYYVSRTSFFRIFMTPPNIYVTF